MSHNLQYIIISPFCKSFIAITSFWQSKSSISTWCHQFLKIKPFKRLSLILRVQFSNSISWTLFQFSILKLFLSFSSPELIPLNCCQTHFKILMRIDRASNCFNFGSATLNCTVARQVEDRSCPGKFTLFAQIYLLIVFRKTSEKRFLSINHTCLSLGR